MLTKPCSVCKEVLPASEFYPHKRMKLGLQPSCKKCARQWHKDRPEYIRKKNAEFKIKNPTYMRDWLRLSKHGLSAEAVNAIREKQNGLCAVCGKLLSETKECLDHDHSSGKVRGLLCNPCNTALGFVYDSTETLLRMVSYLETNKIEAENY